MRYNIKKISIKYFNSVEKIEKIPKGDWIDLRSAEDITLKKGEFKLIPLGIAMQLPKGHEAWIRPRGSTYKNYKIIMATNIRNRFLRFISNLFTNKEFIQVNSQGVVDETYCGDNDQWFFPAYALKDTEIKFNDRICQFRVVENMENSLEIEFNEVKTLDNQDRGSYGSTGIK